MILTENIGARLKAARKRKKLSVEELGLESLTTPQTIEAIEEGTRSQVPHLVIERIGHALGVDLTQ